MPRHRPRPPSPPQSNQGRVTAADVDRAADALLRAGERPTIDKVRLRIGHGSPNTINPLLDAWWSRLAGRLDAGPAALHRLPEPVLLAAEGLWMQTLDEARRRAAAEQGSRKASLAKDRQDLEVRSHVLSIRESELTSRLAGQRPPHRAARDRTRHAHHAAAQGAGLPPRRRTPLERTATWRRATAWPGPKPTATAAGRSKSRTPVRKPPRTGVARKRTVTTKRKPR